MKELFRGPHCRVWRHCCMNPRDSSDSTVSRTALPGMVFPGYDGVVTMKGIMILPLVSYIYVYQKGVFKMDERLLEILEEIEPEVDYETCTTLIDDHIINSLALLSLIAELEEEYDITIPTVEIVPANFNSASAMWKMITKLQEED